MVFNEFRVASINLLQIYDYFPKNRHTPYIFLHCKLRIVNQMNTPSVSRAKKNGNKSPKDFFHYLSVIFSPFKL